jgi:hypothetical protein
LAAGRWSLAVRQLLNSHRQAEQHFAERICQRLTTNDQRLSFP